MTAVSRRSSHRRALQRLWQVGSPHNSRAIVPTMTRRRPTTSKGSSGRAWWAGSVLATAVGGVVFCALRLRGRHVLAPAMLHVAFNDVAYLTAWWVRS